MRISYSAEIPAHIPSGESIVLPISMNQPLERGERLAAIIQSIKAHHYEDRTTILVCDFLNRHNCHNASEALDQGESFLREHKTILSGFHIVRWKDFIESKQDVFTTRLTEVREKNIETSHFHLKMKKTWEKCLSATQLLDASIEYQMEEYAALLCMEEFKHLFYPKRITNGLAYVYNYFSGEKPKYHHIKISETKVLSKEELFTMLKEKSSDRRHIHIAFRGLLEHMDNLLASDELSEKAKEIFAEETENLLMSYGLLKKLKQEFVVKS